MPLCAHFTLFLSGFFLLIKYANTVLNSSKGDPWRNLPSAVFGIDYRIEVAN